MSETKKEKAKSFLEKNIPIPPHFYAQVDDDDALIASKSVILPFTLALQILQIVAVVVFFTIYSLPMSNIVTTRIEPDWDYRKDEGWNCTPLSADYLYNTRFNYDTCRELYSEPSTTTVLEKEHAGGVKYWRYYPFLNIVDMGIALPSEYINDLETDPASQTPLAQGIFNPMKELNSCGDTGMGDNTEQDAFATAYTEWDIPQSVDTSQPGGPPSTCTITQAEAIEMYKAYNLAVDPCYYGKTNAPYSCQHEAPKPILERLSLAYANGLLVYTLISAAVVQAFFANSKKKKEEELKSLQSSGKTVAVASIKENTV